MRAFTCGQHLTDTRCLSPRYGNFHTVLVNCSEMMVYNYDLEGIHCARTPIVESVGIDPRVCSSCAIPFGIRDTAGGWPSDFTWRQPTVDAESSSTTFTASAGSLGLSLVVAANSTPVEETVSQAGWQTTIISFSNFTTSFEPSVFVPPACFDGRR